MKKSITGYRYRALKFSDHSHRKLFGAAPIEPIVPIGRDVSTVPNYFQGSQNACVSCATAWCRSWLEQEHPTLSWEWLANASGTSADGVYPGDVLDTARKEGIATDLQGTDALKHRVGSYYYVDLKPNEIYSALKKSVLAVGVDSPRFGGAHFLVAYDVTNDGKLKCHNSQCPSEQENEITVDFSEIVECIGFGGDLAPASASFPIHEVIWDNIASYPFRSIGVALLSALTALTPVASQHFGSGGVYDVYSPTVAGAGQSSTATTLPVSTFSLTDGSGNSVATTTIQFPVYLTVNPRSTSIREVEECNGIDTAGVKFIGCNRAITCNNLTNSTSTIAGGAYAHAAGEPVILSNNNCFFNRFMDTFTTQNIGGTKTFTTSTVLIGDNTTTTGKQITFRVGQSNNPYFKIVGPTGANTTSTFFFSLDGTTDLQLNASGTTFGASSTGGVVIQNGLIALSPSTTQAIKVDSLNTAYVDTSSTASTNGGFILVNATLRKIYWDIVSFLAGSWTWTGTQAFNATTTFGAQTTFSSTSTFNAPLVITNVSSTNDSSVSSVSYVNNTVANNVATGTSGGTITAGNALYISSTSSLQVTNTSVASSTFQFVGIATESVSNGVTVHYTKPGGINCQQSGLSAGFQQYLNGTAGQLSSTAGTFVARIGTALSATCVQVMNPKYIRTGTQNITSNTTFFQEVGFFPAIVNVRAGFSAVGGRIGGTSVGDDTNNCTLSVPGVGVTGNAAFDASKAWKIFDDTNAAVRNAGTISSKTATGFILNNTTYNADATVQWTAESL